MLNKAIEIATKAHTGQTDKGGEQYILHPLRVMMNCDNEAARICAVLHDVVEDTAITLDDLRKEGFSDEIIAALDCLTRRADEQYDDFITRILSNQLACQVKIADLCDNMDLTRIPNPTTEDENRMMKYKDAADRVSEALPYADEIPDCRYIEINGCVEVPPYITTDKFMDMFIRFIEAHGWFFGGGIGEMTDEEEE